ncbi:polyprenyl synthetase family protein [Cryobacterium sp. SO2]|uniref:polyprenyl synthetase family protein n=1 Tax=Cryobacterium sp. SO2 TaxID=1897060 RepID=UPI00223D1840|nr:polyprenyl synthetase family protein [Cryobacterium sp. SO2]WEO79031.1 polyprenyl synthetase family protein [Cryobacterium sp. SO2]
MAQSTRLVDLVHSRIDEFINTRESIVTTISPDLAVLVDFSRQFLSGGKRFRAQFAYLGWQSVPAPSTGPAAGALTGLVSAASALEVFHAAALVHDDIIDNSDTRRGAPSAHRRFESLHGAQGWAGSPDDFGRASAILLGDLLLGWSDELLDEGLDDAPDRLSARRARAEFNRMRTEVTAGQYLDILEERAWITQAESELLDRAVRVIVFKSAKYSVQAPLVIGAALAGADDDHLDTLRDFGLPLGIAYQLRDDLLGVFGDAAVTGKPSGDDLREGKRTVLIALARERLNSADLSTLDSLLGRQDLTPDQIVYLQESIVASGAVDRVETLIQENVAEALAVLDASLVEPGVAGQLSDFAGTVTRRAF